MFGLHSRPQSPMVTMQQPNNLDIYATNTHVQQLPPHPHHVPQHPQPHPPPRGDFQQQAPGHPNQPQTWISQSPGGSRAISPWASPHLSPSRPPQAMRNRSPSPQGGSTCGFGFRINDARVVTAVHEIMDEHDRIRVDAVGLGDTLLEVDGVVIDAMSPEGAKSMIFGPPGMPVTLLLWSATSGGQYRLRAKRHVPVRLWHAWGQDQNLSPRRQSPAQRPMQPPVPNLHFSPLPRPELAYPQSRPRSPPHSPDRIEGVLHATAQMQQQQHMMQLSPRSDVSSAGNTPRMRAQRHDGSPSPRRDHGHALHTALRAAMGYANTTGDAVIMRLLQDVQRRIANFEEQHERDLRSAHEREAMLTAASATTYDGSTDVEKLREQLARSIDQARSADLEATTAQATCQMATARMALLEEQLARLMSGGDSAKMEEETRRYRHLQKVIEKVQADRQDLNETEAQRRATEEQLARIHAELNRQKRAAEEEIHRVRTELHAQLQASQEEAGRLKAELHAKLQASQEEAGRLKAEVDAMRKGPTEEDVRRLRAELYGQLQAAQEDAGRLKSELDVIRRNQDSSDEAKRARAELEWKEAELQKRDQLCADLRQELSKKDQLCAELRETLLREQAEGVRVREEADIIAHQMRSLEGMAAAGRGGAGGEEIARLSAELEEAKAVVALKEREAASAKDELQVMAREMARELEDVRAAVASKQRESDAARREMQMMAEEWRLKVESLDRAHSEKEFRLKKQINQLVQVAALQRDKAIKLDAEAGPQAERLQDADLEVRMLRFYLSSLPGPPLVSAESG